MKSLYFSGNKNPGKLKIVTTYSPWGGLCFLRKVIHLKIVPFLSANISSTIVNMSSIIINFMRTDSKNIIFVNGKWGFAKSLRFMNSCLPHSVRGFIGYQPIIVRNKM